MFLMASGIVALVVSLLCILFVTTTHMTRNTQKSREINILELVDIPNELLEFGVLHPAHLVPRLHFALSPLPAPSRGAHGQNGRLAHQHERVGHGVSAC